MVIASQAPRSSGRWRTGVAQDTFRKFMELAADLDAKAVRMARKPGDSNGGA